MYKKMEKLDIESINDLTLKKYIEGIFNCWYDTINEYGFNKIQSSFLNDSIVLYEIEKDGKK